VDGIWMKSNNLRKIQKSRKVLKVLRAKLLFVG